jgi:hypothetical protein
MGRGTGTGMGMGTGRGTGTGRGRGTGRGTGKGRGTGRGMGREERPMKLAAYSKQGQTMILRIEIYEPLTEEQVRLIKGSLAEMGVKDITVERFPEPEDEEEDELTEPQDDDILTEDHRGLEAAHAGVSGERAVLPEHLVGQRSRQHPPDQRRTGRQILRPVNESLKGRSR